jgi:hypothetical protein
LAKRTHRVLAVFATTISRHGDTLVDAAAQVNEQPLLSGSALSSHWALPATALIDELDNRESLTKPDLPLS